MRAAGIGLAVALAAAAAAASLHGATAQESEAPDDWGWSRMMMGPMAACPMGAGAPGMMGRFMTGPGMMMGRGMMGRMGGMGHDDAGVDAQLDALHDQLAVTSEQENAWDAYAAAARTDVQVMASMHASMSTFMRGGSTNAPDWLNAHRTMMRARADSLDALASAVDALYAQLDETQKTTFDRYGGGMCGAW